mmetsp:Transcript_8482/g.12650  ORF Transcript_8482/g.12650 Transcript_8482/m.12650 type:complete len:92 (-) Transcript_8482:158-433(-)
MEAYTVQLLLAGLTSFNCHGWTADTSTWMSRSTSYLSKRSPSDVKALSIVVGRYKAGIGSGMAYWNRVCVYSLVYTSSMRDAICVCYRIDE